MVIIWDRMCIILPTRQLLDGTGLSYEMAFDTLSIKSILMLERENPRIKLDYPPDISFDSVHIELIYQHEPIAIIPFSPRRVTESKFQIEELPESGILPRITGLFMAIVLVIKGGGSCRQDLSFTSEVTRTLSQTIFENENQTAPIKIESYSNQTYPIF